jgi:hypothetical protein
MEAHPLFVYEAQRALICIIKGEKAKKEKPCKATKWL